MFSWATQILLLYNGFFSHNNVYHYFTGTRCPREEKYGTKTESWTSNKIAQQHVTERDETVERKAWYHSMIEIVWHSMWNKKSVTTPANHRTNNIDWRCLGQIYYFKRLNLAVNSKVEAKRFQEKKNVYETQHPAWNSDEQDANFNNNNFMQWSLRRRQPYTILVKTCKNNMFLK